MRSTTYVPSRLSFCAYKSPSTSILLRTFLIIRPTTLLPSILSNVLLREHLVERSIERPTSILSSLLLMRVHLLETPPTWTYIFLQHLNSCPGRLAFIFLLRSLYVLGAKRRRPGKLSTDIHPTPSLNFEPELPKVSKLCSGTCALFFWYSCACTSSSVLPTVLLSNKRTAHS